MAAVDANSNGRDSDDYEGERNMRTGLMNRIYLLFSLAFVMMLILPAAGFALEASPSETSSSAPTIQSDQADYPPGATVTLTGSNWQPGESVHINVNDDVGQTWSRDVDVTADTSGAIQDQFQLPNYFIATYKVTATGGQSGMVTTSFTDGNLSFKGPGATSPAPSSWTVNYTNYGSKATPNNSCNNTGASGSKTISPGNTGKATQGIPTTDSVKLGAVTVPADSTLVFDYWTDQAGNTVNNNACISGNPATGTNGNVTDLTAHFKSANQAPVANSQSVTTNEDTAKPITLTGTDADGNT